MKKCLLFLTTIALILSLSTNAFAKNTSGDLSQKQALQLALSAREHFWNTMSGHNPKVKKQFAHQAHSSIKIFNMYTCAVI